MVKKSRFSDLNKGLEKPPKEKKKKPVQEAASAPRGERAGYFRTTVTLPPDVWFALKTVGTKRKMEGKSDCDISSLVREAVSVWLRDT